MANPDTQRKLLAAGLFILPVLAVKASTMLLLGPAPQAADAAIDTSTTPAITSGPTVSWKPRQLAAAQYIGKLRDEPFGPSPLLFDYVEPEPEPDPIPTVDPTPIKTEIKFTVNAVMSGVRGRTALIDGRPYSEGHNVRRTGWIVELIDCDSRSVTLREEATGERRVISVELPSPNLFGIDPQN